jgi:hypothetical protein
MTSTSIYVEQFKRVERSYQRLVEINNGKIHDRESDFLFDDYLNFFMNCYHLKDWIKNDPTMKSGDEKLVEEFISNSKCLSICGDIANGAKHFTLTSSRSCSNIKRGNAQFKLILDEIPQISAKYTYIVDGIPMDAFDLATQCLQDWNIFIRRL